MAGINKVILVGNLGKDPELKYFEGNIAKVNFSLATSETYKDKNGTKTEHTEWHHIVLWRTPAENASKLLKKGMQIYLEGKLQTRQWTDKDGHKKNITEIIAENFTLLQSRETPGNSYKQDPGSENLPY
ncbi:MAG: single-stranded DNA-binding protein [Bacteroidetes bacterium]|nr:single-stranded DNA-binding protein [Bacteroidota bacterium]